MKQTHKDISVIIPVYNGESVIINCLSALEEQTEKNFNIIIIDDGSTDNTSEIIHRHILKSKIEIIYKYQDNRGPSSARNEGLKIANSKYIIFVDADDIPKNNFIKLLYESIEYENVDFAFGQYITIDSQTLKIRQLKRNITNSCILNCDDLCCNFLTHKISIPLWGSIFKKSIIDKNSLLFTEDCRRGEDLEFVAKYLLCCEKAYAINEEIYSFFYNSDRECMRTLKYINQLNLVYERILKFNEETSKNELVNKIIEYELIPTDAITTMMGYAYAEKSYNFFIKKIPLLLEKSKTINCVNMRYYTFIKRKLVVILAEYFPRIFYIASKKIYPKIFKVW